MKRNPSASSASTWWSILLPSAVQSPRQRHARRSQLIAVVLACGGIALFLLAWSAVRSETEPSVPLVQNSLSIAEDTEDHCPSPIVDWSRFPGDVRGNSAGILVEDLADPALPWVIYTLQSLQYSIVLYALDSGTAREAQSFLKQSNLEQSVRVDQVVANRYMVNASMVHVFVYMPMDDSSIFTGRGAINLLLMPATKHHIKSATQSDPGARSSRRAQGRKTVLRGGTQGAGPRDIPSAAQHVHEPDLSEIQQPPSPAELALATYDFLLYRSVDDCTQHLQVLTPTLERLQHDNRMFPLVDVLSIPLTRPERGDKAFRAKVGQVTHRAGLNKVIRFFMQSTLGAYKARLTPDIQQARATKYRSIADTHRYATVIVEARPHFAFLYTVLNAAWYLPQWTMHIVHSRMNAGFVKRILSPHLDVVYHQLETENMSIDDYNNLMKNATFWRMLDADYILLFQTDSLILKPGIESFVRFDYIGAPWHLENERWSQPALKAALPAGVGNGGFSLRSARAMIEICEKYSAMSPLKEQEDVFFAIKIEQHEEFELGDRQSAYNFCLEVPCHDMAMKVPYALHAAWYYNDLPTMQRLLDFSLYGLNDC